MSLVIQIDEETNSGSSVLLEIHETGSLFDTSEYRITAEELGYFVAGFLFRRRNSEFTVYLQCVYDRGEKA